MPSPSSHLFSAALRLSGRKKRLADAQSLHRALASRRAQDARSTPPQSLHRSMTVTMEHQRGWECYRLVPRGSAGVSKRVLYLHGGAYVAEISAIQWRAIAKIAAAASAEVVVPIYPLAPSATAEETVATAADITAGLLADATRSLDVVGDSAGGGMVLAVLQQLRDRGLPQPRRAILVGPWLDTTMSNPAITALAPRDVMLDVGGLAEAGRLYAGGLAATDPRVSPLYGELKGLAPIAMFSGTADLVNADAHALLENAADAGVDIDYYECVGGQHCYPFLPTREGKQARTQIVTLLTE
ncbi:alpha/beta hydrolase fold domain-containing protein [Nocardia fluminea]|uniref:alpha/beta hydrolase fold domain-containing protein n=1 Tax=Nocardia fluminea TaxID=134984 RepID=UPI0034150D75